MWETITLSTLMPIIVSVVASYLTYAVAIRTRISEIDIEKQKELNKILSVMLEAYENLMTMYRYLHIKQIDLSSNYIKALFPIIFKQANLYDSNSFSKLDETVEPLKEYDAILYYKFRGLGQRFSYLQENLITPFSEKEKFDDIELNASLVFTKRVIDEFEIFLLRLSKTISYTTYFKVKKIINKYHKSLKLEEIKKDIEKDMRDNINQIFKPVLSKLGIENDRLDEITELLLSGKEVNEELMKYIPIIEMNGLGAIMNMPEVEFAAEEKSNIEGGKEEK